MAIRKRGNGIKRDTASHASGQPGRRAASPQLPIPGWARAGIVAVGLGAAVVGGAGVASASTDGQAGDTKSFDTGQADSSPSADDRSTSSASATPSTHRPGQHHPTARTATRQSTTQRDRPRRVRSESADAAETESDTILQRDLDDAAEAADDSGGAGGGADTDTAETSETATEVTVEDIADSEDSVDPEDPVDPVDAEDAEDAENPETLEAGSAETQTPAADRGEAEAPTESTAEGVTDSEDPETLEADSAEPELLATVDATDGEAEAAAEGTVETAAASTPDPAVAEGTTATSETTTAETATVVMEASAATAVSTSFVGPVQAFILGFASYIYGYPMLEFQRVRDSVPTLNTFYNQTDFVSTDDFTVVALNTDQFYSTAELDLSEGPVVLSVPDMGDRYYTLQFMDPYTNVVGYVGTRTTGNEAGTYVITWEDGPEVDVEIEGAETVVVPYSNIWVFGRTVVGDEEDQEVARELMSQYTLTPYGEAPNEPVPQEPDASGTTDYSGLSGVERLNAISALMAESPPPERDDEFLAKLAKIGVGSGLEVSDANLGLFARVGVELGALAADAWGEGMARIFSYVSALGNDGWLLPREDYGDYGTHYIIRAGVAKYGLAANKREEAMYSVASWDEDMRTLNGSHSYVLHFEPGEEPPANGFWSVTVYTTQGWLVENDLDKYGTGSTHSDLVYQEDGSIDIVLSVTDPEDPNVNWIPIPEDDFQVMLRMYWPGETALDGSWLPPGIERL